MSRLSERYADNEVIEELNAFSAALERNLETELEPGPESDPIWREIARLEREGREEEARRVEKRWLAENGGLDLYDDERFFDID
jgi:hypothetical protein